MDVRQRREGEAGGEGVRAEHVTEMCMHVQDAASRVYVCVECREKAIADAVAAAKREADVTEKKLLAELQALRAEFEMARSLLSQAGAALKTLSRPNLAPCPMCRGSGRK